MCSYGKKDFPPPLEHYREKMQQAFISQALVRMRRQQVYIVACSCECVCVCGTSLPMWVYLGLISLGVFLLYGPVNFGLCMPHVRAC